MSPVVTTWRWSHGALLAAAAPRLRTEWTMTLVAGLALAILPAALLLPPLVALIDEGWATGTRSCVALRTASSCGSAWTQLGIGALVLAGWVLCVVAALRSLAARARRSEHVLSLDPVGITASLAPRRGDCSGARIPWESVLAVRTTDDARALEVDLRPGTTATLVSRRGPVHDAPTGDGPLRIAVAAGAPDRAVLEHFTSPAARASLTGPASADDAARVAREAQTA